MDIIEQINNEALKSKLDTPIEELDISIRAYNCLKKANINTILDIMHVENLIDIRNLGRTCANEIYKKLLEFGIDFDDKEQCKELIEKYNNQKFSSNNNETPKEETKTDNMDIIELMETPIEELGLTEQLIEILEIKKIYNLYLLTLMVDRWKSWLTRYLYPNQRKEIDTLFEKLGINSKEYIKRYEEVRTQTKSEIANILEKTIKELDIKGEFKRLAPYESIMKQNWKDLYQIAKYYEIILREWENKCFQKTNLEKIRKVFNKYGINIDNNEERKKLINEYEKEKGLDKQKNNNLLDKTIYEMQMEKKLPPKAFAFLAENKWFKIIDILEKIGIQNKHTDIYKLGKIKYEGIKKTLNEYGIDLDNQEQVQELIKQYQIDKKTYIKTDEKVAFSLNQLDIVKKENENKTQELEQVTNENDSIENELEKKQAILKKLKDQLERRNKLEQLLNECDKEYNELIKQYSTLNSKERSNNNGTK